MKNWHNADLLQSLKESKHALEKESLRVQPDALLSMQDPPKEWGDPLHHPYITTDFSSAQPEFVTPTFNSEKEALNFLEDLHIFATHTMKNELLWPSSIPCILPDEDSIPIAKFGKSAEGKKKMLYRKGLGLRYGRKMQTLCGIHYNFSFSLRFWELYQHFFYPKKELQDVINLGYLHICRNFLRFGWILTYLFGATPACDLTFLSDRIPFNFSLYKKRTLYNPLSVSLRMSTMGYYLRTESCPCISYNSLSEYIFDMNKALSQPSELFEQYGKNQLNTNILQTPAEYYERIRIKGIVSDQLDSLEKEGIGYLEVRILDIDPFQPLGLDLKQLQFTHLFLLYCLMISSPNMNSKERKTVRENQNIVALSGRNTRVRLDLGGRLIQEKDALAQIFLQMKPAARLLDKAFETSCYQDSLEYYLRLTNDFSLLPSSKIFQILERRKEDLVQIFLGRARAIRSHFLRKNPKHDFSV